MYTPNYLSTIERYHEQEGAIRELINSIITGIAEPRLIQDQGALHKAMEDLSRLYPFVEMLFVLDEDGVQSSEFKVGENQQIKPEWDQGKGRDRSQRPYFQLLKGGESLVLTDPYLSSANRSLCISAAMAIKHGQGVGYLVMDVDLERMISFMLGDTFRQRFEPFFRTIYSLFAAALLVVAGVLFYSGMAELVHTLNLPSGSDEVRIKPFEIIVVLTLALAIFDLAKTVFEEEVLMEKDVHKHSTVRRTMTRFVAAILVALLIEGLLMMFKTAMGYTEQTLLAPWMILASAGLLVALAIYVYLGAKAEKALIIVRQRQGKAGRH
ncbi:MAG: general glycosylation pathway protein [Halothiobacillaceae bacterium]